MKFNSIKITVLLFIVTFHVNAQNTLDNLGLTSSTPSSVAYSLRLLSSSYTGPLVRIKVGSSFYDVYPDASAKNFSLTSKISAVQSVYNSAVAVASVNALSTIISGSTNATVAIWYDQSGYAVHVFSAVIPSTPTQKIISLGNINTSNGQPAIYFDRNDWFMSTNTVDYSAQTGATVNAIAQNIATTTGLGGVIGTAYAAAQPGYGISFDGTNSIGYFSDGAGCESQSTGVNSTDTKILTDIFLNNTTSLSNFYVNSVLRTSSTSACTIYPRSGSKVFIGCARGFGSFAFNGNISEAIIFPTNLSTADRGTLETNQNTAYFSPSVTISSNANNNSVCSGNSVTFAATLYNYTSIPAYQWYKNSVAISGATSATYSTAALSNNDVISVSCTTASNIVNDASLSLWLDAGNTSSYSGTGTTWTNLGTGGVTYNASINAHQTFSLNDGGHFLFDGTANPMLINKVTSATSEVTMSSWVYITPGTTSGSFIKNGANLGYTFGAGGGGGFCNSNFPGMLLAGQSWLGSNPGSSNFLTGWQLCTMVITGSSPTTYKYYINGTLANTATFTGASAPSGSYTAIGDNYGDGGACTPFNSKMAAAYIYSKALTVAEIKQNYNALAPRFGLSTIGTAISSNTITTTFITNNTASAASSTPTLCVNTALTNITHTTTGATGIGTATGLPTGVTAVWATNTITISGTPTASGTFNYSIPLTGGCGSVNATGTITVNALPVLGVIQQNTITNGLNFDGVNDYVTLNSSLLPNTSELTYELWMKPSALSGILLAHSNWSTGYVHFQFHGSQLGFDVNGGNDNICSYVFSTNTWYHVAAVYSATAHTLTFYVNGVLQNTITNNSFPNITGNIPITIGSWSNERYYNGSFDEVRIWNTARTQSQIQAAMITELTGTETGLVAYYNFNQGTAGGTNTGISTLIDKTGNANNGTLNNFALAGAVSNWVGGTTAITTTIGSVTVNSAIQLNNTTSGGVWSTSNAGVASVSSIGFVTGNTAGTATINYTVTNSNNCSATVATSITVNPLNTSSAASSTPTLCNNTALTDITHTTTGATGIGTATGLPTGVTATFASNTNTITIIGTPTVAGTFNYSIPLTGGFGSVNATGTITVNVSPIVNVTVNGDACINKTTLNATTGLTSYSWYKDNVLLSGAITNAYLPSASGDYKVLVSNGTCTNTSSSSTIYFCGVTADGKMVPVDNSTTLISKEGAINNGKGIDERGLIVSKPFVYGTVTSSTGRIWMDRNLGASRVAISSTDTQAYGDYYQWGRPVDGHQTKYLTNNNSTGFTNSRSATSVPSTDLWIQPTDNSNDWLSTPDNSLWTGANPANNPCPAGFRIPTETEWNAERATWTTANAAGAFASPLKLTLPGMLTSFGSSGAGFTAKNNYGQYQTQTAYTNGGVRYFGIEANNAWFDQNYYKSHGMSCRCIKD